jgi:hypothetical protein
MPHNLRTNLNTIIILMIHCIVLPYCEGHTKSPKSKYLTEDLRRIGKTNQDILAAESSGAGGWSALQDCCQEQARSDGLPSCVCEKVVRYPTIQFCGLHQAIDNANADYAAAGKIIDDMNTLVFQEMRNTSLCAAALLKGICAYHFWLCSAAVPDMIYNDICIETCDFVAKECAITLSNFTGLSKSSALHLGCRFGKSNQFVQDCTSSSILMVHNYRFIRFLLFLISVALSMIT